MSKRDVSDARKVVVNWNPLTEKVQTLGLFQKQREQFFTMIEFESHLSHLAQSDTDALCWYCVGYPDNSTLILALNKAGQRIKIATPAGFPDVLTERTRFRTWATAVLHSEQQNWKGARWNVLSGSWHTATAADIAQCGLFDALEHKHPDSVLFGHLRRHPAARMLQFMGRFPIRATTLLLSQIHDVRWFLPPERPERLTNLNLFFSCQDRKQAQALFDAVSKRQIDFHLKQNVVRGFDLVTMWSCLPLRYPNGTTDFYTSLPGNYDHSFNGFFDDIFGSEEPAMLQAGCRMFLKMLVRVWLDGLYLVCGRKPPPFFVPEYFFPGNDRLIERWKSVCKNSLPLLD